MLRVEFVSLFPDMVLSAARHSILQRAETSGLVRFGATNPRDFTTDNHRTVDDDPFGGGPGMVMIGRPILDALDSLKLREDAAVVFTDPTAKRFTQNDASELSKLEEVAFVCGHYEGIDDRVRQLRATHSFSIGDFVLTGGELPALVMADAIVRLLPGALGCAQSLEADSHAEGLLSAPQYTRPAELEGVFVPDVLRSGDHRAVERWRRGLALRLTRQHRPDLFCRARLNRQDLDLLQS